MEGAMTTVTILPIMGMFDLHVARNVSAQLSRFLVVFLFHSFINT